MNSKAQHRPDFLGIGMERAGTSWLFTQIAAHPEIWTPPLKELHFFDVLDPQALYLKHRYRYHLPSRIKQKAAMFKTFEHRPEFYKNSALEYLHWDMRFFTGRFDLSWYQSLFDARYTKGRICGEITPAYSNLSSSSIETILAMNPSIKCLLMVRNPTDRMWSGLVHHFRHLKKRNIEDVSEGEMLEFLELSAAQDRSNVADILATWSALIPKEQLWVKPFESIKIAPKELIKDVYQFLGVDDDFLPPSELWEKKINAYTKKNVTPPKSVKALIDERAAPIIKAVKENRPDIVKAWIAE